MTTRRQSSASAKRKRSPAKKKALPTIHPDMNVSEIVALHDDAAAVLATYGLHCVGCAYNQLESLREGVEAHGLTEDDLSNLIEDLTELIATTPARPQSLTITEAAASALLSIAEAQEKRGWVLRVTSDDTGGFCMEFEESGHEDDLTFTSGVADLVVIASPATLARIGGSTIDHRDGRFKLDLATDSRCGCNEKGCECRQK